MIIVITKSNNNNNKPAKKKQQWDLAEGGEDGAWYRFLMMSPSQTGQKQAANSALASKVGIYFPPYPPLAG